MSSPSRNRLNSNIGKHMFTASIDHSVDGFDSSDNETWMYHQLYDKNGVGYAMQLNTNGNTEMWKTTDNGKNWSNVWSHGYNNNVNLYNVATMNFGFDSDGAYFIEWFFAENNKYHLKFTLNGIQFLRYDGSSWSVLWQK